MSRRLIAATITAAILLVATTTPVLAACIPGRGSQYGLWRAAATHNATAPARFIGVEAELRDTNIYVHYSQQTKPSYAYVEIFAQEGLYDQWVRIVQFGIRVDVNQQYRLFAYATDYYGNEVYNQTWSNSAINGDNSFNEFRISKINAGWRLYLDDELEREIIFPFTWSNGGTRVKVETQIQDKASQFWAKPAAQWAANKMRWTTQYGTAAFGQQIPYNSDSSFINATVYWHSTLHRRLVVSDKDC